MGHDPSYLAQCLAGMQDLEADLEAAGPGGVQVLEAARPRGMQDQDTADHLLSTDYDTLQSVLLSGGCSQHLG